MLGILAKAFADLLGVATFTSRTRHPVDDRGSGSHHDRGAGEPSGRRAPAVGNGRSLGVLLP